MSSNASRRDFLILSAGGAAVVASGWEVTAASSVQAAVGKAAEERGSMSGSLVAHVKDLRGDTVSLLVGEDEVVVRDADLVARLARAAG